MREIRSARSAPAAGADQTPSGDIIEAQVREIVTASRAVLLTRWQSTFRSEPPKGISTRLMAGALAYAVQAKAYGGLKAATRRRLTALATDGQSTAVPPPMPSSSRPGTRLVREWNGMTHVVDVVDGGYLWNGARYRSLSAIARTITGARWSGPRFFGLNARSAT